MKKKHNADFESINPYQRQAPFFIRMEHLARYRWAREMLRIKKSKQVLDIACANGYGSSQLCADERFVLGMDKSYDLIDDAKKRYKGCKFEICDIDENPDMIKKHSPFDAICCFETLEHLKYPQRALYIFSECMTTDGYLLLSIPDGSYEKKDSKGNIISEFHLHAFEVSDIINMIDKSGFIIEKVLHQHLSAQLYRNFNVVARDRGIKAAELEKLFYKDCDNLDLLSEIYAWPDDVKGNSYSTVFLCRKSEK